MAELRQTHVIRLQDGRNAKVREYDDGSVRFVLEFGDDGERYALTECFLARGTSGHAIIKVIPVR